MKQKNSYSRIIQALNDWKRISCGEQIKLFHHCVENDITSFIVFDPNKETLHNTSLGTAFSQSGLSRDEIQFLGGMSALPSDAEDLITEVEETLEQFKIDYLDLYFLDPRSPVEHTIPAVERLLAQGKISEIGMFDPHLFEASVTPLKNKIKAELNNWSLSRLSKELLSWNKPPGTGVEEMLWIHPNELDAHKASLEHLKLKYKASVPEILLAWILQHQGEFHPVLQGHTIQLIDSAARAQQMTLIDEDWKNLPGLILESG